MSYVHSTDTNDMNNAAAADLDAGTLAFGKS